MYKANSQLYTEIVKSIPETSWAYLAGMIDGEGNITIYRNSANGKRQSQYKDGWRRAYVIQITNNSLELLDTIYKKIPLGKVYGPYYYKGHSKKDEYRLFTCFIRYEPNTIRSILPKVIPYLILKREMAEIMQRSLKVGEEVRDKEERRKQLNQLDIEYRLAFLRTKGNKPYTNNKEYWQRRRTEKGMPPIKDILEMEGIEKPLPDLPLPFAQTVKEEKK